MRDLASIQKEFLNGIINDTKNSLKLSSLNIYRDLVSTNHLNALRDVYPVCCKIVGEDYFTYLSRIYLQKRPTNEPDLNLYGHDFSDFLADEISSKKELLTMNYLWEVSKFEWSIYSASRKNFKLNSPEKIISKIVANENGNGNVLFVLNPSLSSSLFNYPIIQIWKKHQNEEVNEIELINSKNYVVAWKHNKDVVYKNIEKDEFDFIKLLNQKKSFNELNELFINKESELENLLAVSIQNAWIVDAQNIQQI
ncbi:MAG: HvfC/BufC family peptide modification chaperone [Thermodesulfobacteriota bacterium]